MKPTMLVVKMALQHNMYWKKGMLTVMVEIQSRVCKLTTSTGVALVILRAKSMLRVFSLRETTEERIKGRIYKRNKEGIEDRDRPS